MPDGQGSLKSPQSKNSDSVVHLDKAHALNKQGLQCLTLCIAHIGQHRWVGLSRQKRDTSSARYMEGKKRGSCAGCN